MEGFIDVEHEVSSDEEEERPLAQVYPHALPNLALLARCYAVATLGGKIDGKVESRNPNSLVHGLCMSGAWVAHGPCMACS